MNWIIFSPWTLFIVIFIKHLICWRYIKETCDMSHITPRQIERITFYFLLWENIFSLRKHTVLTVSGVRLWGGGLWTGLTNLWNRRSPHILSWSIKTHKLIIKCKINQLLRSVQRCHRKEVVLTVINCRVTVWTSDACVNFLYSTYSVLPYWVMRYQQGNRNKSILKKNE